jgi:hypothetical protein
MCGPGTQLQILTLRKTSPGTKAEPSREARNIFSYASPGQIQYSLWTVIGANSAEKVIRSQMNARKLNERIELSFALQRCI